MLFTKISVVLSVIAAATIHVAGFPFRETNAQRMARGLPPSPPKFGRQLPGTVNLDPRAPTPASASSARYPSASPMPPVLQTGHIQARTLDGSILGTLGNSNSSQQIGLNISGSDQDLQVSFTPSAFGQTPFDIQAINPASPGPVFVGASAAVNPSSVGLQNSNAVVLSTVQQTPPNSVPTSYTSDNATVVESAIWYFNGRTKELTAQYIDPNMTKPATVIVYNNSTNLIFFVDNIETLNNSSGIGNVVSAINLFLISN